ncbi:MAG: PQQ-like beta-propeller repeat protein, partial [Bacteroidales bacterium]|nr:PQQ-like beta-propeller repeat protein [Bacteroidales bacterium]
LAYLFLGPQAGATLELRVPIAENEPVLAQTSLPFEGTLTTLDTTPLQARPIAWGQWPGFRGEKGDAIAAVDRADLNLQWDTHPPEVVWDVNLGEGYAGAATRGGHVYVTDYDQEQQGDMIRCFALEDGRELWRYFYPNKVKRNHGMSRTVPAVGKDFVVSLGPKCHVVCLETGTGEERWKRDLVSEDGVKVPEWYAGQCPLVQDDRLILGVGGGDALLMALDCNDGKVIWQTPNPEGWQMTHSSVARMTYAGQETFVYCASDGVVGVAAEDGRVLWQTPDWFIKFAVVPTPVVIDEEHLFLSGGYDTNSVMLKLTQQDDRIVPEILFELEDREFGSEQQTPVFYQGHLYGVRPTQQVACMNLEGEVLWTSPRGKRFGLGPYMVIADLLYVLSERGTMTIAQASPDAYQVVTSAEVLEGPRAWAPMAYVEGMLLIRDENRMVCLSIMR